MLEEVKIEYLDDHRDMIHTLDTHFQTEWSEHYGPDGPGDALSDLKSFCNKAVLPIGLIAIYDHAFCGSVSLRPSSGSHHHLGPWVAALYVVEEMRRQGIGTQLVKEVESLSENLGYTEIYARSSSAIHFFINNHWEPFDSVILGGEHMTLFKKTIRS